jgi:hypothetical protein
MAETVVESVTMKDGAGRVVDFPGKRKLSITPTVSDDGTVELLCDFRNGESYKFTPRKDMYAKFCAHGAEQKLRDEIAGVDDIDDCYLAVTELGGRLDNGEWSLRREGGGMAGTSVLLRALVEYSGKTNEEIKAFLAGIGQAEKIALRSSARVNKAGVSLKAIVDRLEAEKAAKGTKVDTEALLGTLA